MNRNFCLVYIDNYRRHARLNKGTVRAKLIMGEFNDELRFNYGFYDMDIKNGKLLLCLRYGLKWGIFEG